MLAVAALVAWATGEARDRASSDADIGPRSSPQDRLIAAVRQNDASTVAALAAGGVDVDAPAEPSGWRPLLHAVHTRAYDSAAELLTRGADPDGPSADGQRPLIMAASYGDERMVSLLLAAGADASLPGRAARNALDAAVTGTLDPDALTFGQCQDAAVREIVRHAPTLASREAVGPVARAVLYVRGCDEIEALLAGAAAPPAVVTPP